MLFLTTQHSFCSKRAEATKSQHNTASPHKRGEATKSQHNTASPHKRGEAITFTT